MMPNQILNDVLSNNYQLGNKLTHDDFETIERKIQKLSDKIKNTEVEIDLTCRCINKMIRIISNEENSDNINTLKKKYKVYYFYLKALLNSKNKVLHEKALLITPKNKNIQEGEYLNLDSQSFYLYNQSEFEKKISGDINFLNKQLDTAELQEIKYVDQLFLITDKYNVFEGLRTLDVASEKILDKIQNYRMSLNCKEKISRTNDTVFAIKNSLFSKMKLFSINEFATMLIIEKLKKSAVETSIENK